MSLVTFKDLCIDANDPAALGAFYGRTFGLRVELLDDGDVVLRGPEKVQTVWINRVPEEKTVKQRVHPDVWALSHTNFVGLPRVSEIGQFRWTTYQDPEGGEFCAFVHEERRGPALKSIVVDAVDSEKIARWWQALIGGELGSNDGAWWVDLSEVLPWEGFDFVPVPEPKTVKNRVHWDVTLEPGVTLDDLIARGATILRAQDDEIRWTVMADPEGNEFCVFAS